MFSFQADQILVYANIEKITLIIFQGVRRTVEEMEDRKIRLLEGCTAHREENVRISRCLSDFLEKYEQLSNWLSDIVEAFLRGHQDMGSDLTMARDFHRVKNLSVSIWMNEKFLLNEYLKFR